MARKRKKKRGRGAQTPSPVSLVHSVHDNIARMSKRQKTLDVSNPVKVTAKLTGLSEPTVRAYLNRSPDWEPAAGNRTNHPVAVPDEATPIAREYLRGRHKTHTWTTIANIKAHLVGEGVIDDSVSRESIRQFLNRIGYRWGTSEHEKTHFYEDPEKVAELVAFERQLDDLEADGWTLAFTDESYCNQHHRSQYGWFSEDDNNLRVNQKGKRVCIVGAGTAEGWIRGSLVVFDAQKKTGDYHGNFTSELYTRWFTKELLPNLDPDKKYAIVTDSASYHVARPPGTPNVSKMKRDELEAAMEKYGLEILADYTAKDLKNVLREHIERNIPPAISTLAEKAGHMVIFQPKGFHEVQPIEKVWAWVKGQVARLYHKVKGGGTPYEKMKKSVTDHLRQLPENLWRNVVRHARDIGREYAARYGDYEAPE